MAGNRHNPVRNLFVPVAIMLLGLSAFQYYEQREVTWHKDPAGALNDIILRVRSLWRSDEQAPFVIERSQPSDQVRPIRELTGQDSIAADIDSRYIDPGEPRFEVRVAGNEFPIRLHGVDAPEYDQPHGEDASRALARKLQRRSVLINIVDIDSYGRLVGTVYYQGENINLAMIAEGHGWWYEQYARSEDHLEDAESAAREAGLGLWSSANPIAPWDWRRAN
jgi:endonuclease YncB( thermonuclease family)